MNNSFYALSSNIYIHNKNNYYYTYLHSLNGALQAVSCIGNRQVNELDFENKVHSHDDLLHYIILISSMSLK